MDEPAMEGIAEPSNDGTVEPANDEAIEPAKGGRPRRWDKDPENKPTKVGVKLPPPLAAALKAKAAEQGLSVQDFFGRLAAEVTGVPYDVEVPEKAA